MVAARVTRAHDCSADNDVRCCLSDPRVPGLAVELGTTRSAAALHLWGSDLDGAVVAIGNAPTALFELLELIDAGGPRPVARRRRTCRVRRCRRVVRSARRAHRPGVPHRARPPRRLGDHRRRDQRTGHPERTMTGTLYGVGLRPGDSELVTVKAARLISAADVIAYHCARHGRSIARGVAVPYLRDGQIEERLMYPVTTETVDHLAATTARWPYTESAARLADHLPPAATWCSRRGRPTVLQPYMHMHKRPRAASPRRSCPV